MSLYGVGMDAVVDLGQVSLHIPTKLFLLQLLHALEFLDQVEFELDRDP